MHLRRFLLFAALSLGVIACSKRVAPSVPEPPKNINIEEIDFEYFHGKSRINVKDDKGERDVKANIRMRKDSVIWMDISVVGVSGARALINKDSLTIRSNVDKEYFVFEFTELTKRFNFETNFHIIQAAMLGNLLYDRRPEDVVSTDGSFNILEQKIGTITIKNYINSASTKLEKVELSESNTSNSLVITYSNFQSVGTKVFPFNGFVEITYKTPGGILKNTILIEWSKAEVGDRELRFPFNIPKNMNEGRTCIFLLLLLLAVPAFSQKTQKTKSQLQKEKQANLEKIKETERILQETSNRKKNSLGELSALNQRITQQEELIISINQEITLLDADIKENQEIVAALENDVENLKKEYAAMVFSAQKAGGRINKLTFLFSASSFDQFMMRLKYMKQYGKARQDQAAAIGRFQNMLNDQIHQTEVIRESKNQLLIDEISESKSLASLKDKQKVLVRTLQKEEKKLKSDIEDTRKAVAQLDDLIAEIVREEIERAAREAREAKKKATASRANESATALSNSFEENRKKFTWPATGFVSQKFGKQNHPALKGIVINNNGINIQTKMDEKVKCIFNGEVRKVALIGVLGNSVIINHGDYFSVYAGLKEVFVKRGEQVTTNQEIGQVLVNSEGVSELKFMIYKNNTALDPQLWLKN